MIKYRTEELSGSGCREIFDVLKFEIFELTNNDIFLTLIEKSKTCKKCQDNFISIYQIFRIWKNSDSHVNINENDVINELISNINDFYEDEINHCLWLCNSVEDIDSSYGEMLHGDETITIDMYECGNIVLSDLGLEGSLYGFNRLPEKVGSLEIKHNIFIE